MISRMSSGSSRTESAVEPTRSQNMTVSWRRSAEDVDGTIAGDAGEPAASAVPQLAQNLPPSGISALQFGQTMPHLCSLERLKEALIDVATKAEPGMATWKCRGHLAVAALARRQLPSYRKGDRSWLVLVETERRRS